MGSNSRQNRRAEAAKPSSRQAKGVGSGEWQGFVNVTLPPGAKQAWQAWHEMGTPLTDGLDRMLLDGYKITLKYEEQNDCYSAFCTGATSDHNNSGWGLSERSGSSAVALSRLVYIHTVVLNGDWDAYKTAPTPYNRWD